MEPTLPDAAAPLWDLSDIDHLIEELWRLRAVMCAYAERLGPWTAPMAAAQRLSAANLAHYLALREFDMRSIQSRLARLGLSSLGRSETHVLANLDKVLGILHRLVGREWAPLQQDEPAGFHTGAQLLEQHATALFGAASEQRRVRIMVTLPGEAALDGALVHDMVRSGMDVARINCAHDGAAQWLAMVEHVRAAARQAGRQVRVLMDLGGPKLRTGPVGDAPAVLKLQPQRDALGRVVVRACLVLFPSDGAAPQDAAMPVVGVDPRWLARLKPGDRVELSDARDAQRRFEVIRRAGATVLLEGDQTTYLTVTTQLRLQRRHHPAHTTGLSGLQAPPGRVRLQRGQVLHLVAEGLGHDAVPAAKGRRARPATMACTLPEVLPAMRKGEAVWFDDGRIGAVVLRGGRKRVILEVTVARDAGEFLAADKGINLPDTRLDLPALTEKDLQDLDVVARHADLVGLSFAQSAADVLALRRHLDQRGAEKLGMVLKIETRRGFEHLPDMLLAAMRGPGAAVMIARGDLAVECGYERMAELQEEILWACEAAHTPVVWATQVLETLARTGLPSRAEITDAAMGGRAECVMLNKGPHILDAMRTLDDILRRMQTHQTKKRPMLRRLRAWHMPQAVEEAAPAP
jgi:pyruvate kinase